MKESLNHASTCTCTKIHASVTQHGSCMLRDQVNDFIQNLCSAQALLTQHSSQRQGEGQSLARFSDLMSRLNCCANASDSTAKKGLLTAQAFPLTGKLVQAAGFWYALCKGSCWLHTVLLQKLDTTDDSCLVLPRTLTNRRYWFLCLLRAAQLPSQGCVFNPVLLDHYCCLHRSATSATVVSRGGEPAHRKVCCLACCACSHR